MNDGGRSGVARYMDSPYMDQDRAEESCLQHVSIPDDGVVTAWVGHVPEIATI